MNSQALWGIDLGGSKIEGVVLRSGKDPIVLCRKRIATEGERGYAFVLEQIKHLIDMLVDEVGFKPKRLGIGTPGSINPLTDRLKGCNSQHLNDQALHVDLAALLGIPVNIANDANCFALAETRMGIVADQFAHATTVFGVIMGTGVGGGLVINGELVNGKHGIAGEWGHNFLHDSGGDCYCGRRGCVETILSGPALQNYYHGLSNQHLELKQIVANASGDEYAEQTMQHLFSHFSLAIANVINILDPDVIIIGGGVGNIHRLYSEGLMSLSKYVFHPVVSTDIVAPALGDSAGVFGAAFL